MWGPQEDEVGEDEDDEDEDDEEEGGAFDNVLVPVGGMQLDPAVMSTLPPSMQLDLLQRMRDHKIFENREHFQQRAQQPGSFSSFQIQEYLKASAFRCVLFRPGAVLACEECPGLRPEYGPANRRQMESVKDAMNASAMAGASGGVANRIAAEEGREYILQVRARRDGFAHARSAPRSSRSASLARTVHACAER